MSFDVQGLILGSLLTLVSLGKAGQSAMKVEMCSLVWHSLTDCYWRRCRIFRALRERIEREKNMVDTADWRLVNQIDMARKCWRQRMRNSYRTMMDAFSVVDWNRVVDVSSKADHLGASPCTIAVVSLSISEYFSGALRYKKRKKNGNNDNTQTATLKARVAWKRRVSGYGILVPSRNFGVDATTLNCWLSL